LARVLLCTPLASKIVSLDKLENSDMTIYKFMTIKKEEMCEILEDENKRWIYTADVDDLLFHRDMLNELDKVDLQKFTDVQCQYYI
jgi:hypothetical protein